MLGALTQRLLGVAAALAAGSCALSLYFCTRRRQFCAVCGVSNSTSGSGGGGGAPLRQKKIVPAEYRKHLPDEWKRHRPVDIVRLCPTCHAVSERRDDRLKNCLALAFAAPRGNRQSVLLDGASSRSAASALRRHRRRLPPERILELERQAGWLRDVQSDDDVGGAGEDVRHGARVVGALLKSSSRLADFERLWRCHFQATMQPAFMPKGWSVW